MNVDFLLLYFFFLETGTLFQGFKRKPFVVLGDLVESGRVKRSSIPQFRIPQPTAEFPLVLFVGDNYNNGTNGQVHRSRPNEYRVWARTMSNSLQEFVYRSLLVLPGWELTFQACCASGNTWIVSVGNVSNISSLHYFMFDNLDVGQGIFYTQWLHWVQEFSVKAEKCDDPAVCATNNNTTCSVTCYFGSCGLDGHCQCKDGYSGDSCETRPPNHEVYPNVTYPLVLFPEKDFKGSPVKVLPDSYHAFAKNFENKRTFLFLSARILFTRSITFSRDKEDTQKSIVSPGSDINNLESYFASNTNTGEPLWFNYATTIDSQFYIKVEDNPHCTNCSETGGCCYTGKCICLPGFNGTYCTQ